MNWKDVKSCILGHFNDQKPQLPPGDSSQELTVYNEDKQKHIQLVKTVTNRIDQFEESTCQHLVQAYAKNPSQFQSDRAVLVNTENWPKYYESRNIQSIEEAFQYKHLVPSIATMRKYMPMQTLVFIIETWVMDVVCAVQVKNKMSMSQINEVSQMLAGTKEFHHLTIDEIKLILSRGKTGFYNPDGFFNSFGMNDLFKWFRAYEKERTIFTENLEMKRIGKQSGTILSKTSILDAYNKMKHQKSLPPAEDNESDHQKKMQTFRNKKLEELRKKFHVPAHIAKDIKVQSNVDVQKDIANTNAFQSGYSAFMQEKPRNPPYPRKPSFATLRIKWLEGYDQAQKTE